MGVEEIFKEAAERVKSLSSASNDDQLELYSYFKQSNFGDCNTGMCPQERNWSILYLSLINVQTD